MATKTSGKVGNEGQRAKDRGKGARQVSPARRSHRLPGLEGNPKARSTHQAAPTRLT